MANNPLTLSQLNRYISLLTSGGVPREALIAALDAASVPYSPNDDLDWSIPAPDQVSAALDELALASRGGTTGVAGISGASPVTVDLPPAITPVKSGKFLMMWQFAWNASSNGNCTCTPRIDGADVAGDARNVFLAGAGNYNVVIPSLATLNRATTHTVGWKWTYNLGALTAGVGRVYWYEL